MSARLPERVDPLRLAELGRTFHGRLPLARLVRLGQSLCDQAGEVEVELAFGRDEQGRLTLSGRIDAA